MPRVTARVGAAKADTVAEDKIRKTSEKKAAQKISKPKEQQAGRTESTAGQTMDAMAQDTVWKCEECHEGFVDEDCKVFECEVCGLHFCWRCLDISVKEYSWLSKRPDLHWYCSECEGNALLSIKTDKEIAKQCADYFRTMEDKLNSLEKEVSRKADKEQMRALEDKMQEKADKAAVKQIDERMQKIEDKMNQEKQCCIDKHNSESGTVKGPGHGELNHIVDKNINEQKNRDRRKENIVVFNIGESTSEDVDDRKLYDLSEADRLLNTELNIGATATNPVRLKLKER
jgi:hypothetical protein